jgi:hypothetical protein
VQVPASRQGIRRMGEGYPGMGEGPHDQPGAVIAGRAGPAPAVPVPEGVRLGPVQRGVPGPGPAVGESRGPGRGGVRRGGEREENRPGQEAG